MSNVAVKKQTVLVVDDMPEVIKALTDILKNEYHVRSCMSGEEAIDIVSGEDIDLILLDISLPGLDGFETFSQIQKLEKPDKIPVIFISGNDNIKNEVKALEIGGVDFISKPFTPAIIKKRVKTHIMIKGYQESLKYLVEQTVNQLKVENLAKEKSKLLYQSLLESIEDAVFLTDINGYIEHASPSVKKLFGYEPEELVGKKVDVLIPERFADHDGYIEHFTSGEYTRTQRSMERVLHGDDEPISRDNDDLSVQLAAKLVAKRKDNTEFPVSITLKILEIENERKITAVVEDLSERNKWEETLYYLAMYDDLTGLANRKFFMNKIDYAIKLSRRMPEQNMALIMIDLDYFKPVNDTYGHQVGDEVLKHVATIMQDQIREVDTVARLGGDEFAIVLVSDERDIKENSFNVSQRLLEYISQPFKVSGHSIHLGCSIGISLLENKEQSVEEVIRQADKALYRSKDMGRNCMTIYNDGTTTCNKDSINAAKQVASGTS